MVSKPEKITVGFFPPSNRAWMGGVNFYCNLFYALERASSIDFDLVVFVGRVTSDDVIDMYKPHKTKIVKTAFLDRFSLGGIVDRLCYKTIGIRPFLSRLLKKYSIDAVSHVVYDMGVSVKQIGWIPDFQHLHLSQMFTEKEIHNRNKSFLKIARNSEAVILSSYDALKDYKNFTKLYAGKGYVAQFVSQPPDLYFSLTENDETELKLKYDITCPYIYVPNQFWQHKNHYLLLQAIALIKKRGGNPLILCSGLMEDYRDQTYIEKLKSFVTENGISDNVKFLGLIPYKDVFSLIKYSIVVLNPSRFEGWSSTVEECKSVGKLMLLSDIPVHKEQHPAALFFKSDSVESLAIQIEAALQSTADIKVDELASNEQRTKEYAETYCQILMQTIKAEMPRENNG